MQIENGYVVVPYTDHTGLHCNADYYSVVEVSLVLGLDYDELCKLSLYAYYRGEMVIDYIQKHCSCESNSIEYED